MFSDYASVDYMSNMKYSLLIKYSLDGRYIERLIEVMIITVRIDELLEEKGRSFYWLSKQTQISHTTLWRLKKGKALGINFATLEKICQALECEPGDVLRLGVAKPEKKGKAKAKPPEKIGNQPTTGFDRSS